MSRRATSSLVLALGAAVAVASGGCLRVGLDALHRDLEAGPSDADAAADGDADVDGDGDASGGDADAEGDADGGDADGADGDADDAGPVDADLECEEDPCRLVLPQCGCPPGQMCQRTVAGSPERRCVPDGTTDVGEVCAWSVDCIPGHTCLKASTADGICERYCASNADCALTECVRFVVSEDPVGACYPICDPLTGEGCAGAFACRAAHAERLEDAEVIGATVCGPSTGGAAGEPCSGPFDCAPGTLCVGPTCRAICRRPDDVCSTGTCTSLAPTLVVGETEYGACL